MEFQQPPIDPTDPVDMGIEVGNADLVDGDSQGPPQPNAAPPAEYDAFGEDLLDQETRDILQASIASSTCSGYNSTNIRLIRFLHSRCTTYPNVLNPILMGNLLVADEEDRRRMTKSGKPSKVKDSNKKAILDFFNAIKQDDPSTYPINFEHLTFNAFKKTVTKRKFSSPNETITIA